MSRIIIAALALALSSTLPAAQAATGAAPEIAANAPDRHVVVRGDTLWGISAKFLKDPFRWSEVWQLNKDEIKDPHWIYPGQVVELDRATGKLRLAGGTGGLGTEKLLPRTREERLTNAIPAISRQAIEPFLTQPLVTDGEALKTDPRIVAFEEGHSIGEAGNLIYAVNIPADEKNRKWQIVRPGKPLKDPTSGEVLAYEATVVGAARLDQPGDPATLRVLSAKSEIVQNDRLARQPSADIVNYPLRSPSTPVAAQVLSISGDYTAAGNNYVVSLSRGSKDGIERGHVLGLFRPGQKITDRFDGRARDLVTPEERFGLIYIFRVFDRVSFGLVMQAQRPLAVGDAVRNP